MIGLVVTLFTGLANNEAYGYTVSVPPYLTFTPMFTNGKTKSFGYKLGLGVDVDIYSNWRIGGGYHCIGAGGAYLGLGILDTAVFPNSCPRPLICS